MEVIDQPTLNPNETTLNVPAPVLSGRERSAKHHFTKENAAAMSARARQLRAERLEKLRLAAEPARMSDEQYRLASLARTRELIAKLEKELDSCVNPQAGHYLVSSIAKLRDAEQKLAMRPLPGSHRPSKASTARPTAIEPSE